MNKPEKKTYYYEDGSVRREGWYLDGKYHREDGPAHIRYYEDGSIEREEWYLNDNFHREDGPAWVSYYEDGNVEKEIWYINSGYHREDGPAWVRYYEDGSVEREGWCLKGRQLSKEDFKSLEQIKRMKAFRLFTPVELAKMRCEVING